MPIIAMRGTNVLKQITYISKDLSVLKGELPKALMIGRIEFSLLPDEKSRKISWDKRQRTIRGESYYHVVFNEGYTVSSLMLAPVKVGSRPDKPTGDICEGQSITPSEILEFVKTIGDVNPIHRRNHPVVPGLMILERMLVEARDFIESGRYRFAVIKFTSLLYSGECYRIIGNTMMNMKTNEPVAHLVLEEE